MHVTQNTKAKKATQVKIEKYNAHVASGTNTEKQKLGPTSTRKISRPMQQTMTQSERMDRVVKIENTNREPTC